MLGELGLLGGKVGVTHISMEYKHFKITKLFAHYMGLILAPAEGMWLSATYGAIWAPFSRAL